jgi:hypothetical protein
VLGALIHWVKPYGWAVPGAGPRERPLQNYAHAAFGLAIIGGAFYQLHNGYTEEWPATHRETPRGVHVAWIVWVCVCSAPSAPWSTCC